jgi:hypothetical protein
MSNMRRPLLTTDQIVAWADAFFRSCKRWPKRKDGRIPGSLGETWCAMDQALRKCWRGISHKSSLAQLLQERRQVRNRMRLPRLTIAKILSWADDHYDRKGSWPTANSGVVNAAPSEQWSAIDRAMRGGNRGLPGGTSLAKLLYSKRRVRAANNMPHLTIKLIIQWAKSFKKREGLWPTRELGIIVEAPQETWKSVNAALVQGDRGLPGGSSLAQLLSKTVGYRNRKALPALSIKQILQWADEYKAHHQRWPTHRAGAIKGSNGETWSGVHTALCRGYRGLPGNSSLYQVLLKSRGVPRHRSQSK